VGIGIPCFLAAALIFVGGWLGGGAHRIAAAQGQLVDGIAAVVGGHAPGPHTDVVLRSDVELRARLALARRTSQAPVGPLPPELLASALDEIVNELLIAREARRLRATEPGPTQVARQREEIARSVGGEERLRRFCEELSVGLDEIDAIATRRAYVDAFLRANLEGSTFISDAEVERVYASGDHPFTGAPLEEVREALRTWLAQAALEREVARWVEVLRSRTPVRIVVRFAPNAVERAGSEAASRFDHGLLGRR
jgi:hypothetical protein